MLGKTLSRFKPSGGNAAMNAAAAGIGLLEAWTESDRQRRGQLLTADELVRKYRETQRLDEMQKATREREQREQENENAKSEDEIDQQPEKENSKSEDENDQPVSPRNEETDPLLNPEQNEESESSSNNERNVQESDIDNLVQQVNPPPVHADNFKKWLAGIVIGSNLDVVQKIAKWLWDIYIKNKEGTIIKEEDTTFSDPNRVNKTIQERISMPIPKQCQRHIYVDGYGQLRTIVYCGEQQNQRVYFDF